MLNLIDDFMKSNEIKVKGYYSESDSIPESIRWEISLDGNGYADYVKAIVTFSDEGEDDDISMVFSTDGALGDCKVYSDCAYQISLSYNNIDWVNVELLDKSSMTYDETYGIYVAIHKL